MNAHIAVSYIENITQSEKNSRHFYNHSNNLKQSPVLWSSNHMKIQC